jgi:adenylosuccinate synthase
MQKSDFFVPGKITVTLDGGMGSSGKGMCNSSIASRFAPDAVICNNMPNAGHCVVVHTSDFTGRVDSGLSEKIFRQLPDGTYKAIFKVFPASSIVTKDCPILIAPDAGFSIDRFFEELRMIDDPSRIKVHPRACIVTKEHADRAAQNKHISGTMSGAGPAQAKKLMRDEDCDIAMKHEELKPFLADTSTIVQSILRNDGSVLFELPQGFDLSLNHGYEWPKLTSRDITAAMAANSCGISPKRVGKIFINVRPYPIRVGNVAGESSGTCYDSPELTWEEINRRSGADMFGVDLTEITTVTMRKRRVFEFSAEQVRRACAVNEPDGICVTFTCQIDYRSNATCSIDEIPKDALAKIARFIAKVEAASGGIPVIAIATGPDCRHFLGVNEELRELANCFKRGSK